MIKGSLSNVILFFMLATKPQLNLFRIQAGTPQNPSKDKESLQQNCRLCSMHLLFSKIFYFILCWQLQYEQKQKQSSRRMDAVSSVWTKIRLWKNMSAVFLEMRERSHTNTQLICIHVWVSIVFMNHQLIWSILGYLQEMRWCGKQTRRSVPFMFNILITWTGQMNI